MMGASFALRGSITRMLGGLVIVTAMAQAQDSRKAPESRDVATIGGRTFLGLYSVDVKLGCGALERTVTDDGIVLAVNVATDTTIAPGRLVASYSRVLEFDAQHPHQLRAASESIETPQAGSESIKIEKRVLSVEGTTAVWKRTLSRRDAFGPGATLADETNRTALPRHTIEDELRAERWIRGGAGAGSSLTVPRLDLLARKVRMLRLQIVKRATRRTPGLAESRMVLCAERDDGGNESFVAFRPDGWPCFFEVPSNLAVRAEPDGVAQSSIGWDGHFAGPILVQHPFVASGTEKLNLIATGSLAGVIDSLPGQLVEKDGDGFAVRLDLKRRSEPVSAADRRKWIEPSPDIPSLDHDIAVFAKEAIQNAPASGRDRIVALLAAVREAVPEVAIPDGVTAAQVLSHRRGGPRGRALLFVAAARALKIPAREVRGLSYEGEGRRSFFPHWWAEVELDGAWMAVDPSKSQIPADIAHLRCRPLPETALPVDRSSSLSLEPKR
jgi:hypothetical protein